MRYDLQAGTPADRGGESVRGTILVLDDEAALWDVMAAMLAWGGYRAVFTADGAEAVRLYRESAAAGHPFAGVITDLTIPGGMGGEEVVRRLREIDPDVRAIITSGYTADPVLAHYAEYGFRGVLDKPFRLDELVRVLRRVTAA